MKKIGDPLLPPSSEFGIKVTRGPEKAEEGVAENRIRERCFPNGSRLTLVCGRVKGTSESLFFFHPVFLIPYYDARGGYGSPVRSARRQAAP